MYLVAHSIMLFTHLPQKCSICVQRNSWQSVRIPLATNREQLVVFYMIQKLWQILWPICNAVPCVQHTLDMFVNVETV